MLFRSIKNVHIKNWCILTTGQNKASLDVLQYIFKLNRCRSKTKTDQFSNEMQKCEEYVVF